MAGLLKVKNTESIHLNMISPLQISYLMGFLTWEFITSGKILPLGDRVSLRSMSAPSRGVPPLDWPWLSGNWFHNVIYSSSFPSCLLLARLQPLTAEGNLSAEQAQNKLQLGPKTHQTYPFSSKEILDLLQIYTGPFPPPPPYFLGWVGLGLNEVKTNSCV